MLLRGRESEGRATYTEPLCVNQWRVAVLQQEEAYEQLVERWRPPVEPAWSTRHPVGTIMHLLNSAAASLSPALTGHVARALEKLGVMDRVVGDDQVKKYVQCCLKKTGGLQGPQYDPSNSGNCLHRHVAAVVPVAALLRNEGASLLSALRSTEVAPAAAPPTYVELRARDEAREPLGPISAKSGQIRFCPPGGKLAPQVTI